MKRAERMASLQPCNQIRNKILIQIAGGEKKKIPQKKSLKNKKKKKREFKRFDHSHRGRSRILWEFDTDRVRLSFGLVDCSDRLSTACGRKTLASLHTKNWDAISVCYR